MFRIEKVKIDGSENFYYEVKDKSNISSLPIEIKSTVELLIKAIEDSATQVNDLYISKSKMAQNAEKLRKADAELAELTKESQDARDALDKEKTEHKATKAKKDELEERIRTKQTEIESLKEAFESDLERVKREHDKQIETYKLKIAQLNNTQKCQLEELTSKVKDLRDKHIESVKAYEAQIKNLKNQIDSLNISCQDTESVTTIPEYSLSKTNLSLGNSNQIRAVSQSQSNHSIGNIGIKMNNNLPTFSGRPDQSVSEWIFQVNRLLEVSGYTDREKIIIAANYLNDTALSDYIVEERENEITTWEQFKSYMLKRFTPKNLSEAIRNKLDQLRQTTSVEDYYIEYRRLATQLHDRSLTDKIKSFIDGLRPSLTAWVRYHNPKTVEDAFDIASRFETLQRQSNKSVSFFTAQEDEDLGENCEKVRQGYSFMTISHTS